jgi:uncharacterized protein YajQ (UPF0234 family)
MPSFDVVSKVQWSEVDNALGQAQKELAQRFDFQGTGAAAEKVEDGISVTASTEDRSRAAVKVVEEKLIKRKVSLKHVEVQEPAPGPKGSSKILIKIKEGIEVDKARKIVAHIKETKLKVTASIMDAQVRVTGKNKDDLQAAMRSLRGLDLDIELQFMNFRD